MKRGFETSYLAIRLLLGWAIGNRALRSNSPRRFFNNNCAPPSGLGPGRTHSDIVLGPTEIRFELFKTKLSITNIFNLQFEFWFEFKWRPSFAMGSRQDAERTSEGHRTDAERTSDFNGKQPLVSVYAHVAARKPFPSLVVFQLGSFHAPPSGTRSASKLLIFCGNKNQTSITIKERSRKWNKNANFTSGVNLQLLFINLIYNNI